MIVCYVSTLCMYVRTCGSKGNPLVIGESRSQCGKPIVLCIYFTYVCTYTVHASLTSSLSVRFIRPDALGHHMVPAIMICSSRHHGCRYIQFPPSRYQFGRMSDISQPPRGSRHHDIHVSSIGAISITKRSFAHGRHFCQPHSVETCTSQ